MTIEPPDPARPTPPPTPLDDHGSLTGGPWPSATSWIAIAAVVIIAFIAFFIHG